MQSLLADHFATPPRRLHGCIYLLLAVVLTLLMPSADSLWIDEGNTWEIVHDASAAEFFSRLLNAKGSEALMPMGMTCAWFSAKLFGTGEWNMRFPNALYIIGALLVLARVGKLYEVKWLPLFFSIQPFVWYYTNEARPYALQLLGGTLLLAAFSEADCGSAENNNSLWWWGFGALLLCTTNMLGFFVLAGVSVVMLGLILRRKLKIQINGYVPLLGSIPALLCVACFYLHALGKGAGSAKLWGVSPANVIFAIYEMLGFTGLGPSRQQIRSSAREALTAFSAEPLILAGLFSLGVAILCLLYFGWKLCARRHLVFQLWSIVAISTALLALLAVVAGFPFWGRHLAGTFPFLCLSLAVLGKDCLQDNHWRARAIFWVSCSLLLVSAWQLRFNPRHRKDDYRGASLIAKNAIHEKRMVLWAADPATANYYQLPVTHEYYVPGSALFVRSNTSYELATRWAPDVVVLSKSDVYDSSGRIAEYIKTQRLLKTGDLQAFTIWEKPKDQ